MSHESNTEVTLTVYWLSREAEPRTFSYPALQGWYRLKRRLLADVSHLQIHNALHIALFRLHGDDLVECLSEAIVPGVYYAWIKPQMEERLDYIYQMEDADLWRWTYKTQEGTATLSFMENRRGQFCRLQEFRHAKQAGLPVPWHPSIGAFLYWIMEDGLDRTVGSHLLLLWHQHR
jgi:hypothetical protein